MTYVTKYKIAFTNYEEQEVEILLQKKDGEESDIIEYAATSVKLSYKADEGKYTDIFGLSAEVVFDMQADDPDYWPDFEDATADDWKMIITVDTQTMFIGFVVPDEGARPFQDKPFDSKITATDCIGLLKNIPYIQPNHTEFSGDNYIIWYLAAALQQTGFTLPIRIIDNVFHSTFATSDDDPKWCMFNQTKLSARTFKKNATDFCSAWDALNVILKENYRLFQWKGRWMIVRLSMIQYYPFVGYYVDVDYNGANPVGHQIEENYATVGKNELIYPINENQILSNKPAIKSVKTSFNYDVWDEIPLNNKFERGTLLEAGNIIDTNDSNGDGSSTDVIGTFETYSINDWTYGRPASTGNFENLLSTPNRNYVRREYDLQKIETSRVVHLENFSGGGVDYFLRSEILKVRKGDKINVSVDHKLNYDSVGTYYGFGVGLRNPLNNQLWMLTNAGTWTLGISSVSYTVLSGDSSTQFHTISKESAPIPFDGNLYILLKAPQPNSSTSYYQNLSFDYLPYVAGGYRQVKGDYWETSQDKNIADKLEDEIFISDSRHKVVKGCLLDSDGNPLSADWHRHGINESRHFKEITNLEKFNNYYRRFWFIEGSFNGIVFAPSNDQENFQPMGLHKQYRFADISNDDRRFMLGAPLDMDLITAETQANFYEVYRDYQEPYLQPEAVQVLVGRIRAAIDATTAEQWDSEGNAPAPGTFGFPPITSDYIGIGTSNPRRFMVFMNIGAEMTVTTSSPDTQISREVNPSYLGYAVMAFTVDKYKAADTITFSAYGHNIIITVAGTEIMLPADGGRLGDHSEFKYVFE